ncbi:MAG: glycosyltransferase [Clostridia bacterium]|nr:glycosyltransferase [Clostridia bacterium]
MLNVSSLYFLIAILREQFERLSSLVSAQQVAWGAAALAAVFALLGLILRAPKDDVRINWRDRFGRLALVLGLFAAAAAAYSHRLFLSELAGRYGDVNFVLALGAMGALCLLLLPVYLFLSKKPTADSSLNPRQKLGFFLFLLLATTALLAARRFAYTPYVEVLLGLFIAAEVINLVCWLYDPLLYLLSRLVRVRIKPVHPPTPTYLNRFAVIGCAHNEEAVIGKLIESVYKNAYPRDRYDLYVICDNCTDGTVGRVKQAGAIPMIREAPEKRGKPLALAWMFDALREKRHTGDLYDAYIILDADNVVNEGYLDAVNSKLNEGHEVIQTYLGCKNPDDTWISMAYSLSYWLSNVNYQDAHARMGLSAQLGGTGMVFRPSVLEEIGWDTDTLTEDLMMTAHYVRARRRPCAWAHDARLYDEKPLHMHASMRQRTRWMQGHIEAGIAYGIPTMLRGIVHLSWLELDAGFYLLRPLLNLIMFITFMARWGIALVFPASPLNQAFLMSPAAATLLLVFYLLMQTHSLYREGYKRSALWIPIGYVFALTWYLPILRGVIKRKERAWVSTSHTRGLSIGDVKDDTTIDEAMGRMDGLDNLHRMTLGQILVQSSTITSEQLEAALDHQRQEGGQLGEIILNMRVINKETLDMYLALQESLREKMERDGLPESLRLGDLLIDAKVITRGQLDEAIAYQSAHNCLLGEALVNIQAMSNETLETFLHIQKVLDENYLTPQRALHLISGIMRESVNNLGMLLFAGGLISRYQLDVALAYQREHGGVLGEIIVKLGFVSEEHINALLEIQKTNRNKRGQKGEQAV